MTRIAHRLRLVQPRAMGKIKADYLTLRPGAKGTTRWFFQPPSRDRKHGWAAVRLHDEFERPISDELEAAAACRPLAEIYKKWRAGEPGFGPHMINQLGRVVKPKAEGEQQKKMERRAEVLNRAYKPGQVGAMVHDYKQHDLYLSRRPKTKKDYGYYLGMLVEKFGPDYWQDITAGAAREWIVAHAYADGPSGAHSLYRTCRAFFNKCRLIYKQKGHPGIVPKNANPFESLDLSLPTAGLIVWPRAAVDDFVTLADELGQPSIGDAVTYMAWLSTRKQDWIKFPATYFDKPMFAFRQEKTGRPQVLPWEVVPELQARVAAAKIRRTADAVTAATFFHDKQGLPWTDDGFRDAFNVIREELARRKATYATRYYVGLVEGDPLCVPTLALTTRTLRHTCITLNHDAGVSREQIAALSGHGLQTIDDVMRHYTAYTADQAETALKIRLEHEAAEKKVTA